MRIPLLAILSSMILMMPCIASSEEHDAEEIVDTPSPLHAYATLGWGSMVKPVQGAYYKNISLEVGARTDTPGFDIILGMGISRIFDKDKVPEATLDWPSHHPVDEVISYRDGGESLMYVRVGVELYKRLYLSGLGGVSKLQKRRISYDYNPEFTHSHDEGRTDRTHGMYGVGLSYFFPPIGVATSLDYDNRRGLTLMLGIGF